jgi:RNA polymerase sigma-70 factor (ECF subfamily)
MSLDQAATIVAPALVRLPEIAAPGVPASCSQVSEDAGTCSGGSRAAELELSRACAAGDGAAIRAFEAAFFGELRACHRRIQPQALDLDELAQRVREKLFVKRAISSYSGNGDLRRWLRVLTTRLIYDHMRSHHPEVPLEEELLPDARVLAVDASLAKSQLRAEIRMALRQAFAALTDRQQLLVRSEVRGTAPSAIAATYQVHLRSIQRWIREAHETFLAEFRRVLAQRLRLAPGELSSVLTFARSQLLSGLGALVDDSASPDARSA